tara:strand:- start:40 stop:510 length:471 start_codon:yes stop_codon:yes gene_type:complete
MEGSKIPKELLPLNESLRCLDPFLVHLISTDSIIKTDDDYVCFHKSYYSSKPIPSIKTRSKIEEGSWGLESLFLPVTSFDGYNVLLVENMEKEAIKEFLNKEKSNKSGDNFDIESHYFIDAFSINNVDTKKLTDKGMNQFKLALVALEDYETLMTL